jgi:hypothetical protein
VRHPRHSSGLGESIDMQSHSNRLEQLYALALRYHRHPLAVWECHLTRPWGMARVEAI